MIRSDVIRLFLVSSVFLGGCAGRSDWPDMRDLSEEKPEATVTEGWLNPKTLSIHGLEQTPEEGDMVLRGVFTGWLFAPRGDIDGTLHPVPEVSKSVACWLQLTYRTIHYEADGGPPTPPYLTGRFDRDNRLFYPSSLSVTRATP